MRALLVFPPATDPAHPPLGIAALCAYVAEHGEDVHTLDLNVLSYPWLLSPENLERCAERLERRVAELESRGSLLPGELAEYRRAVPSLLAAPYLEERIADVLAAFRQPETYRDMEVYQERVTILRRAMALVSAAHHPLEWAPRNMLMGHLPTRSAEVLRATGDRDQNPFLAFFEAQMEGIDALDPSLIGISINYYSQLIPGMSLAAQLKQRRPDRPVVAGGGLIGFFCDDWNALAPFRGLVDAFVPFEGERPLLGILHTQKKGRALETVPGVLTFGDSGARYTRPVAPVRASQLPPPDYGDLPLDLYLAPEMVLPMQTSRGCYWGRCAFCSHSHLYRGRFERKEGGKVVSEMRSLSRRFGARHFYFTDECIPPVAAAQIADNLRREATRFVWCGEMRLERSLDPAVIAGLARGGARMLMFGLESASRRVLGRMEKGTDPEDASTILQACHSNGIRAVVMLFIGFPGETREEADETLRFLLEHRPFIRHIAATRFILEHQAPVYRRAAEFGIDPVPNPPEEDLKTFSEYGHEAGLGREEAAAFVCDLRTRPELAQLADQNVVSRSHFLFLPRQPLERTPPAEPPGPSWAEPSEVRLLRRPDLVGLTLPYPFDEIDERNASKEPTGLAPRPTAYVFSPELEKMLDVGEDGLSLIASCNGRFSLGEVLETVGGQNRDAVLDFYRELVRAGMLEWEQRA
jgi:anaerobic magnesium-protoporphyrin IX monomethyl ester cyclase